MRVISIRKCQDLPFVGLASGQIIALLRNSIGLDCNRGNDYRNAHALFVLTFGRRRHCALFPIIDLALVVPSAIGPSVGTLLGRGDEQTCCAAMRSVAVVIRVAQVTLSPMDRALDM